MSLTRHEKRVVRSLLKSNAHRLLGSISSVHYTQSASRWSWKQYNHLRIPFYGDCSSTVTCLYWLALVVRLGKHDDILNGANWQAGFTGTLAQHGKRISGRPGTRRVGDLVLYGAAPTYEHVAMMVGPNLVFSHGGEAGPFLLPPNYRSDIGEFRRYI